LPWGHNVRLVEAVKDPTERLWYARQAIEHGWSRNILVHQIESNLYHRQGKAITNFERLFSIRRFEVKRFQAFHIPDV
jgi:predicted nuclease of restriction endonuclease-like (RecB) superfamily